MIISRRLEKGVKNNTCIRCFFGMKESLMDKSVAYKEKYGLTPQFKAGLHCGKVTTGEIGVLKKEIMFTCDVLNTTARIEGLCNNYDLDILVSDSITDKLDLSLYSKVESVGKNTLTGKDVQFELFTLYHI
ncbi:adenylate/guanylate cyclase domain-containing protein [Flavobacterium chryseum]|uniref:adenylate/guanylate cyclase domain-containing protein n=1 Tax=Flavobacterium sp. P3160 TaxID=2512113 RepID=UPI001FB6D88D